MSAVSPILLASLVEIGNHKQGMCNRPAHKKLTVAESMKYHHDDPREDNRKWYIYPLIPNLASVSIAL